MSDPPFHISEPSLGGESATMSSGNNKAAAGKTRTAAKEQVKNTWQQRRLQSQAAKQQQQQHQVIGEGGAAADTTEITDTTDVKVLATQPSAWAAATAQQQQQFQYNSLTTTTTTPASTATTTTAQMKPLPSVCYVMKKTWDQVLSDLGNGWNNKKNSSHQHHHHNSHNKMKAPSARSSSTADKTNNITSSSSSNAPHHQQSGGTTTTTTNIKNPDKRTNRAFFPSVLSILEQNALVRQVNSLKGGTTNTNSDGDASTVSAESTQDSALIESHVLSVLPTGYDWNKAVQETAARRTRAFWLLDLAAIVRTTVDWKHRYCGGAKKGRLLFVYDIHLSSNTDAVLLQVLLQSGIVALTTTTKWDIERARSAVRKAGVSSGSQIYDCTAVTGKPDGYLREWIDNGNNNGTTTTTTMSAGSTTTTLSRPLAVDGPDEVVRICASVKRILSRRCRRSELGSSDSIDGQSANDATHQLDFVLRLEGNDVEAWKSIVKSTATALGDNSSRLVGISIDISSSIPSSDMSTPPPKDHHQPPSQMEAIDSLLDYLAEHSEDDSKMGRRNVIGSSLRVDLTGLPGISSTSGTTTAGFSAELVAWWDRLLQRQNVSKLAVDATNLLVAPAGALCTRIIGVREQKQQVVDDGSKADDPTTSSTDGTASAIEKSFIVRRHYYIDDGCYGSLYQKDPENSSPLCPLPLFSHHDQQITGGRTANGDSEGSSIIYPTTIWGPTCDGLDQVCKDMPLPRLQRDDWLVFPNLGCSNSEGLGTAFNGFDPPDTAYCVLGYFGN